MSVESSNYLSASFQAPQAGRWYSGILFAFTAIFDEDNVGTTFFMSEKNGATS